ncbi:MAG: DUF1573 domain-containing protein [Kiritimatiellae bacterium]|nr:DUF1573 domain-containing protein [Kiritimatiellia bacterium]
MRRQTLEWPVGGRGARRWKSWGGRWLALVLIPAVLPAAARAVPAVQVNPPALDFGRVRAQDPELVRRLRIRNAGDEPLRIEGIDSGCGCAEVRVEHDLVPVGAATEMIVRLNLLGRRGKFYREVVLRTNDPRNPSVKIPIVAEILSPWALTPTGVMFGDLSPDRSATQSLRLSFDPPTGRLISAEVSAQWLRAAVRPEGPGVWQIEVAAVPPYPSAGWLTERLILSTDRPDIGQIVVGCSVVVRQPLMLLPTELRVEAGSRGSQFVLLSGGGAAALEVERVQLAGRPLRWQARRLADGAIQLRLDDLPSTPEWDGHDVEIHTRPPADGPLKLKLRVISDR